MTRDPAALEPIRVGEAEPPYRHVLAPIDLGPVRVPNRFYFAPHGHPTWILSRNGVPDDDFIAYVAERAAGGVGLIFHSLPVLPNVQYGRHCPLDEATVPAFAAVADAVHHHGARLFAQLSVMVREPRWGPRAPAAPTLAVSSLRRPDGRTTARTASERDLATLLDGFRLCAHHLARADYDGVELHAAHGLFVAQFLSGHFNHRTDAHGGPLEARATFILGALGAIRAGLGPDRAVGIRLNCDEMLPDGLSPDEASTLLEMLERRGLIDFADLDVAVEPQQMDWAMPTYLQPQQLYRSRVKEVRRGLQHTPVLSTLGRVTDLAAADEAIRTGVVELVGSVRGLVAEPALVRHAKDGTPERSRTCIGANLCAAMTLTGVWGCALNPATGRERTAGAARQQAADHPRRVLVAGGGPGGLEAARTATLRGHTVVLAEASSVLGGQLRRWATLPGREHLATAIRWWERELARLDVTVLLDQTVDADVVAAQQVDAVIVATGARYLREALPGTIPGCHRAVVTTPEPVIDGTLSAHGRVVVIDNEGTNAGIGVAELLASQGASVELVTPFDRPAEHQTGTWETISLIPRAVASGVTISAHHRAIEIEEASVTVRDTWTGRERRIEALDHIVLLAGREAVDPLAHDRGLVAELYTVGDALAPRGLAEATFEGQHFAKLIGEGGPRTSMDVFWQSAGLA